MENCKPKGYIDPQTFLYLGFFAPDFFLKAALVFLKYFFLSLKSAFGLVFPKLFLPTLDALVSFRDLT